MLFNSQAFILLFLPVVLVAYYAAASQPLWRQAALILASLVFYAWWDPRFLPLLIGQAGVTWLLAEAYFRWGGLGWITLGIVWNIALLAFFKYAAFLAGVLVGLAGLSVPEFSIPLPIAISFCTFQLISYLVDVQRGDGRHYDPRQFFLFVFLFPHLIAGPIVRHSEIMPQLEQSPLRPGLDLRLAQGFTFFIIGFAKKAILTDPLAQVSDPVFAAAAIGTPSLLDAWHAALAFSMQLFLDFSAYSEMAIGLGLMLGLRFPDNFDAPYRALDLRDFWRRWHMTLSRFIRDYLYIPLGGSRHGMTRYVMASLLAMGLCGLWHGAGWTFVAWGLMHGAGLIAHRFWSESGRQLPDVVAWLLTMLFVLVGWVLFRAPEFATAGHMFQGMLGAGGFKSTVALSWALPAAIAVALIGPTTKSFVETQLTPRPWMAAGMAGLAVYSLLLAGGGSTEFIYFRF